MIFLLHSIDFSSHFLTYIHIIRLSRMIILKSTARKSRESITYNIIMLTDAFVGLVDRKTTINMCIWDGLAAEGPISRPRYHHY